MTATALRLTNRETDAWNALPPALREGWTVEAEDGTAYESADVLKIRAGMARFDSYPALRDMVQALADGGAVDTSALGDMPESVLPELCFTVGARGVTALIAALLSAMSTDEDVAALAGLSSIRADILRTNASVTADTL